MFVFSRNLGSKGLLLLANFLFPRSEEKMVGFSSASLPPFPTIKREAVTQGRIREDRLPDAE